MHFLRRASRLGAAVLIVLPGLTACAKTTVPVSVHGVNYAQDEFRYVIQDPLNSKNTAGGETVGPFAAGGTMCCYDLPAKWRSGLQVKITATHWLKAKPDGSLPEVEETKVVELPPYLNGKAGELWVVRAADGQLSVVSSDFQPDHPKWPGKVKGWPVPSLAYQRERWDLEIEHEQGAVELYTSLLKKLREDPQKHASEMWDYAQKRQPQEIAGFRGPQDTAYQASLLKEYQASLSRAQEKVLDLKKRRP